MYLSFFFNGENDHQKLKTQIKSGYSHQNSAQDVYNYCLKLKPYVAVFVQPWGSIAN